jgi:hypothetical protein
MTISLCGRRSGSRQDQATATNLLLLLGNLDTHLLLDDEARDALVTLARVQSRKDLRQSKMASLGESKRFPAVSSIGCPRTRASTRLKLPGRIRTRKMSASAEFVIHILLPFRV